MPIVFGRGTGAYLPQVTAILGLMVALALMVLLSVRLSLTYTSPPVKSASELRGAKLGVLASNSKRGVVRPLGAGGAKRSGRFGGLSSREEGAGRASKVSDVPEGLGRAEQKLSGFAARKLHGGGRMLER